MDNVQDRIDSRIKMLAPILDADDNTRRSGQKICSGISLFYNTLSDYDSITEPLLERLSDGGKKRFFTAWTIAALELIFSYICNGRDPWDSRTTAAMRYADLHRKEIEDAFLKYTGVAVTFKDWSRYDLEVYDSFADWLKQQCCLQDTDFMRKTPWIERFASDVANLHSTIKWVFFGGVVRMYDENAGFLN